MTQKILLVAGILLCLASGLWAQESTGSIIWTVTDASSAVVSGCFR